MHRLPITCLMIVVFLGGCTATKQPASVSSAIPPTSIATPAPVAAETARAQSPLTTPTASESEPVVAVSSSSSATTSAKPENKVVSPVPGTTVKPSTPVKPVPTKPISVATTAEKTALPAPRPVASTEKPPSSESLDLAALEQRLRDTRAIGMFTKLSLKNQVDDLLGDFRAFYAGKVKVSLTELRQRYDLLLMKLLSVLQDNDATLASAIASSREAIWDILKDPKKFAQI